MNINELAERYLDAGLRDGNYNRERNLPDPDMNHGSNLHRSVNMPDPDPYQNHGSDMPDPETAGPCDAEKLSTGLETADKSYPQAKCSDNAPVDKSGLERRIMELHRQGLSSREVARQAGCGKTKVLKTIGLNQ
ncbi:MAG: hypothetical protein LAE24_00195 [Candidatus Contendobacter sp.]|nr:hypothetical protein [Candidatus Contendobacter sp.]